MSRFLLVGNAVLDIINTLPVYPREDEEHRVIAQRIACGGNAANTAAVLARLGQRSELVCTLADDLPAAQIRAELVQAGVTLDQVVTLPGACSPTSYILLNQQNGSRTIAHYRDLPELSVEHLASIDWAVYDWIHFEGRNPAALLAILPMLREQCVDQGISLELEKPRPDLKALVEWVDVVLLSRSYAQAVGVNDPVSLLQQFKSTLPEHILSCTWGEQGSWVVDRTGEVMHQAVPVELMGSVIDTVGAGDVYNAGFIHSLSDGATVAEAAQFAVALSAKKVSHSGLADFLLSY